MDTEPIYSRLPDTVKKVNTVVSEEKLLHATSQSIISISSPVSYQFKTTINTTKTTNNLNLIRSATD